MRFLNFNRKTTPNMSHSLHHPQKNALTPHTITLCPHTHCHQPPSLRNYPHHTNHAPHTPSALLWRVRFSAANTPHSAPIVGCHCQHRDFCQSLPHKRQQPRYVAVSQKIMRRSHRAFPQLHQLVDQLLRSAVYVYFHNQNPFL